MPFSIRNIQSDHGTEFSFGFVLAIEPVGIRHRYIQPRRPEQNGKVERSHHVDAEEFWGRPSSEPFEAAELAIRQWELVVQGAALLDGPEGPDARRETGGRSRCRLTPHAPRRSDSPPGRSRPPLHLAQDASS